MEDRKTGRTPPSSGAGEGGPGRGGIKLGAPPPMRRCVSECQRAGNGTGTSSRMRGMGVPEGPPSLSTYLSEQEQKRHDAVLRLVVSTAAAAAAEAAAFSSSDGYAENTSSCDSSRAGFKGLAPQHEGGSSEGDIKDLMRKHNLRILGNYELGRKLGQGKFSRVVEGIHLRTKKRAALKIMKLRDVMDKDQRTRKQMAVELQALTRVRHENIIQLHGVHWDANYPHKNGSTSKVMVIALELAPNGGLLGRLQDCGIFTEEVSRTYFHQLIGAVEALHLHGITHRDLKPDNLLLDKNFNLKVADFGLSKIFHQDGSQSKLEIMKTKAGTLQYMAPELKPRDVRERPYTSACDIWSCGIILFVMRVGHPPLLEPTSNDKLFQCLVRGDYARFWAFHIHQLRDSHTMKQRQKKEGEGEGGGGGGGGSSSNDCDRDSAGAAKIEMSNDFKELVKSLLSVTANERIRLDEIKQSKWFCGRILSPSELSDILSSTTTDTTKNTSKEHNQAAREGGGGRRGEGGLTAHQCQHERDYDNDDDDDDDGGGGDNDDDHENSRPVAAAVRRNAASAKNSRDPLSLTSDDDDDGYVRFVVS
mmetsp:Transcript_7474/g.11871  ORF Transcript_7474/g.11871 Transcript_7474/m.11871 type:complete len:589 (+) Transcript_7474:49-1815(+)